MTGIVLARSSKKAFEYLHKVEAFLAQRGLKLSQRKTNILPIEKGVDFLSRRYQKIGEDESGRKGKIKVEPSKKAIESFCKGLTETIFSEPYISQRKLIQKVNQKIMGFANYHKVADSEECFGKLDWFANKELMKFLTAKYPQTSFAKLQQKFWLKQADGRYVFCLVKDKKVRILNLADVICTCHQKVDVRKNIFLDTAYFEKLSKQRKMQNVVGKYTGIWRREEGRCFFCNGILEKEIDKEVLMVPFQGRGLVYVHRSCMGGEIQFGKEKEKEIEIEQEKKKNGKFEKLRKYLQNQNAKKLVLSFAKMEQILGFSLCRSAYLYETYWYKKEQGSVREVFENSGYLIVSLNLKKHTIILEQNAESYLFLPTNAQYELEEFYQYILKKYGLKRRSMRGGDVYLNVR